VWIAHAGGGGAVNRQLQRVSISRASGTSPIEHRLTHIDVRVRLAPASFAQPAFGLKASLHYVRGGPSRNHTKWVALPQAPAVELSEL
jgi:hypothetical protein